MVKVVKIIGNIVKLNLLTSIYGRLKYSNLVHLKYKGNFK